MLSQGINSLQLNISGTENGTECDKQRDDVKCSVECVQFHKDSQLNMEEENVSEIKKEVCVRFFADQSITEEELELCEVEGSSHKLLALADPCTCDTYVSVEKNFQSKQCGKQAVAFWEKLAACSDEIKGLIVNMMNEGAVNHLDRERRDTVLGLIGEKVPSINQTPKVAHVVTETSYIPWMPGYVKKDGWIFKDLGAEKYQKLIFCDIECLEVQELYDSTMKSRGSVVFIKVSTAGDQKKFRIELGKTNNTLISKFQSVRGVQIASEVNCLREIQNLLSYLATKMPVKRVIIEQGWCMINGRHYYIYDNHPQIQGYEIACGVRIYRGTNTMPWETFKLALGVFKEWKVAAPVLIYSLYGVTYHLFSTAKYRPTAVMFLEGETGSLKTSVSKVFFRLFNTNEDESVFSFQSTVASIEPKIKEGKDTIFLADDYCINSTMTADSRKRMKALLDRIIRIFGDATSLNKSNIKGTKIETARASGGAVVTGEVNAEGRSSCLRLLTVEIEKGQVDGKELNVFQKNPGLWTGFMEKYILFLEDNFENIVTMISSKYTGLREQAKEYFAEGRSIDHYVEMSLLNEILWNFLQQFGALDYEVREYSVLMMEGVRQCIVNSENLSKQEDPDQEILLTYYQVLCDGTIRIAKTVKEYSREKIYGGYREEGYLFAEVDKLKEAVNSRLRAKNLPYYIRKDREDFRMLHNKFGVIEKLKNGRNSTYVFRTNKPGFRASMLKIKWNLLEQKANEIGFDAM